MVKTKQEEEKEQKTQMEISEAHITIGDVSVACLEGLWSAHACIIELMANKDIQEYLKVFEKEKKLNSASYCE